ncbi:hypothetical protein HC024_14775 [Methylococcaceae bacterium WWC4]|nr:hypothetical protein [Methylococcaceae bacterium WWC4]
MKVDLESNFSALAQLIGEVEAIGNDVLASRGLLRHYITITLPTSFLGVAFNSDDAYLRLPIDSSLFRQLFFGKKYTCFVRNVIEEVSAVAQYGDLKTKLNGFRQVGAYRFA